MADRIAAFREIMRVKPAAEGEAPEGIEHVQAFLERFGYMAGAPERGRVDRNTSEALRKFQEFNGLEPTGIFDERTREVMTFPRCGLPDMTAGAAFSTTCKWNKTDITFAFDTGTAQSPGVSAFDAIRAAFSTWAGAIPLNFKEVGAADGPDVQIGWRPASDPDVAGTGNSLVGGVLAHADFPPGCSVVTNALPKPVHFDDEEHTWVIGAVAGGFDVETVGLHELGHILGLAHSSVPNAVMAPTVAPNFTKRALTADDIAGAQSLYGTVAPPPPPPPPPTPAPPFPGRLLKFPPLTVGEDVRLWQGRMATRGFILGIDGKYGPESKRICMEFQTARGLQVDGIVGPITWGATFGTP